MNLTTTRMSRKKWCRVLSEAKVGTTYNPDATSVSASSSIHPRYSGGFRERTCPELPKFREQPDGAGNRPISEELKAQQKWTEEHRVLGFCSCGCGSKTGVLKYDDKATGRKAGEHAKWAPGHMMSWLRRTRHGLPVDSISRHKLIHDTKAELDTFLYHNRFATRDDIYDHFVAKGFERCAIGVMLRTVVRGYGYNEDEIEMPKRRPLPVALPPYERRYIPYERETELPLLTSLRLFTSLDDFQYDSKRTMHETTIVRVHDWLAPVAMSPLDALLAKEDAEERRKEMWPLIPRGEEEPVRRDGFGFVSPTDA